MYMSNVSFIRCNRFDFACETMFVVHSKSIRCKLTNTHPHSYIHTSKHHLPKKKKKKKKISNS